MNSLNDQRNRGSAQCDKGQVGQNTALVTLALPSEEVLSCQDIPHRTSERSPATMLHPEPIRDLGVGCQSDTSSPQGMPAKTLHRQAHYLEHL